MGVERGYYSPISHGGTYIFATSIALLLYFYRSKPNKQVSLYKIFRYLFSLFLFINIIDNFQLIRKFSLELLLENMKGMNILKKKI